MTTKQKVAPAASTTPDGLARLRAQYGCGPVRFAGTDEALYERHLIFSDYFSRCEPGVFAALRDTLLTNGDKYMRLADLKSYLEAGQRLVELYADPDAWARKASLNVASSGKFSSDRTITEYAASIWDAEPCPVQERSQ